MAAKEMLSLYDAMIRLFVVSMPNDKIPTQLLAHVLNIPVGTMKKVLTGCPLPNNANLVQGGHRGYEYFITQDNYVAPLGRVELAIEIKKERIWEEYDLTLSPNPEEIVIEVEKVLDNIKKLKGNNKKKEAIIKAGDPRAYRVMWFVKDLINGEWYNTVQQAISKNKVGVNKVSPKPLPVGISGVGKSIAAINKYGLMEFVTDVQELIISKNQYLVTIKQMEDKINREYPALISQKEAEKAAAERQVEHLLDRVKVLEKINADQMTEIRNLKKHPKFAGMVKASELRK
jgi:hypothetical protein